MAGPDAGPCAIHQIPCLSCCHWGVCEGNPFLQRGSSSRGALSLGSGWVACPQRAWLGPCLGFHALLLFPRCHWLRADQGWEGFSAPVAQGLTWGQTQPYRPLPVLSLVALRPFRIILPDGPHCSSSGSSPPLLLFHVCGVCFDLRGVVGQIPPPLWSFSQQCPSALPLSGAQGDHVW